jgi:hypothetical protein
MPVQSSTDYLAEHVAGFEGQRANLGLVNITSKVAEGGDIPFGRALVQGTADNQCLLPSAQGERFIGISEHTTAWSENASDLHVYEENRQVNILDFGEIWVVSEQAVVPGDPVYYRHTADTAPLDILGRFRKDASGGDASLVEGAVWTTTASAENIAKIKLTDAKTAGETVTVVATSGALPLTAGTILFDTTAGASTSTLADGTEGQEIVMIMTVDGGDQVLTPANLFGGTTITFDAVGDTVIAKFADGNWHVIGNIGAVVA